MGILVKRKGARNELKARDWCYKHGASYVIKAGASLGAWDLVASMPEEVWLIQVKSMKKPGPAERKRMADFEAKPWERKVLMRFKDYARQPEVTVIP